MVHERIFIHVSISSASSPTPPDDTLSFSIPLTPLYLPNPPHSLSNLHP